MKPIYVKVGLVALFFILSYLGWSLVNAYGLLQNTDLLISLGRLFLVFYSLFTLPFYVTRWLWGRYVQRGKATESAQNSDPA